MSNLEQQGPDPASGAEARKNRNRIIYWASTILLASGMLAGGLGQVFHAKMLVDLLAHLGYPLYFLYILGVWQILGAIAILVPEFSLLKEWAYAGLFFMYTGAAASHFFVGDPVDIWLVANAIIAITSWKLRPDSRRLRSLGMAQGEHTRGRAIGYWAATGMVAFILISGGLWIISNSQFLVDQNPPLGFPAYFWQILGFWKLLGGIAILVPGFRLAKEWAYAGIVFNLTGASAARAFIGDSTAHMIAPLVICGIAIVSWMLRPDSRKVNPGVANTLSKEEAKLSNSASTAWVNQH